ncbi:MAG: hypothetical protein HY006_04130 [Candidatus Sungbacteria bacterium]|nr:hypothetical protein [Candidatus Sungbacteria bacterium]
MKTTRVFAVALVFFAGTLVGAAHAFPLQEDAHVYASPEATVYVMGTSQWHHSVLEALKKRGFEYKGGTPAGHEPAEERYCKVPLQYDINGSRRHRSEISNIHCAKGSAMTVRAFSYESPYYLEWLLDAVDEMTQG